MKFSRAQQFMFQNLIKERKSPCFEVRANQIEILKDPVDYYLALHKLVKQSQNRICMSALYLGTGKLEQYLLERLNNKLETNHQLRMNIILDYMRGTRINSKDGKSSLYLLKEMKEKHIQRNLRVGFWHHPDTGLLKGKFFQGPMKEIFGVHHIKAHVFDHNVMITGANLSEDYFTDRQDRCYIIQDCEPLANYFDDLIGILTDCSFNMNESGDLHMNPQYAVPYKFSKQFKNQMSHHLRFFRFSHRSQVPTNYDLKIEDYFSEEVKEKPNDEDIPLLEATAKPFKNDDAKQEQQPKYQPQSEAEQSLAGEEQVLIENSGLPDEYILNKIVESAKAKKQDDKDSGRVFIFPTLQMNVINYREDEELFINLLKYYANPENNLSRMQLATGYLNLQKDFTKILEKHPSIKADLLTSSPRANGFYKAGLFRKHIPGMYRANEYEILKQNQKNKNIRIFEYENGEWTYHAKGAWFYENDDHPELPVMTVIGSSNYSARSNRRDTECQLYFVSDSLEFRKKLKEEADSLFKNSTEVTIKHITKEDEDKLTWTDYILSKIMNKLL